MRLVALLLGRKGQPITVCAELSRFLQSIYSGIGLLGCLAQGQGKG
jgi:hypothetical protein